MAFFPKVNESPAISLPLTPLIHHRLFLKGLWQEGRYGRNLMSKQMAEPFFLSVVVFSHTPCILHFSSSPHCFLELKVRHAWRKHGLVKSTAWRVKGFSCSNVNRVCIFLLHDLVGRHFGFGIIFLGLPSASQFHLISNFPAFIFRNGSRLQPSDSWFSILSTYPHRSNCSSPFSIILKTSLLTKLGLLFSIPFSPHWDELFPLKMNWLKTGDQSSHLHKIYPDLLCISPKVPPFLTLCFSPFHGMHWNAFPHIFMSE